jgi:putative addiction module component (TIGR02574 family)
MSHQASQLLDAALQLPPAERGELISQLIDSMGSDEGMEFSENLGDEVARRIAEVNDGSVQMIPWTTARPMIMDDRDDQSTP